MELKFVRGYFYRNLVSMLLLGFDFETTGLDPAVDKIIEVGIALWDTDLRTPIKMMDFFVHNPETVFNDKTISLTGITPEMCEKYGYTSEKGVKQFLLWYHSADAIVAHNGREFDLKFLQTWADIHNYELPVKPLIDTKTDLDDQIPESYSRKLQYLAADEGFINFFAHRALFDVMTMLRILDKYDANRALALGAIPNIRVAAISTYDQRETVKAFGYHWFPEAKTWQRVIKENQLEAETVRAREAGFKIEVIPNA